MARVQVWMGSLVMLVAAGCVGDDVLVDSDDAGRSDSSVTVPDGGDTGAPVDDAARPDSSSDDAALRDAAAEDSAVADAATDAFDAGPACSLFSACGAGDFMDMTATDALTITFGGAAGLTYSPKCVTVSRGTTVTFSGDFLTHPLSQSCGPVDAIPGDASGDFSIDLTTAGDYGYFCLNHGTANGGGMAGMIQVR